MISLSQRLQRSRFLILATLRYHNTIVIATSHSLLATSRSRSRKDSFSFSQRFILNASFSQHHVLPHTALFSHSLLVYTLHCHYCSKWNITCYVIQTRVSWIISKGGSESCYQLWERYVALPDAMYLAQRAVSALAALGALTARQSGQSGQSGRCRFPDVYWKDGSWCSTHKQSLTARIIFYSNNYRFVDVRYWL